MNSDIEYFKARGEKLKSQISEAEDKNRRLSSLRLVFFILAATAVGAGIAKADIRIVMIILALILAAVFIALCVKHGKSKALYSHLVLIGEINERYIARINGDYSKLDPSMPDIDIKGHDYAFDLDVFGDVSLYRLYNLSGTYLGREAVAKELLGFNSHDDIPDRQKACAELMAKREFLQEFEALSIEKEMQKSPNVLASFCSGKDKFSAKLRTVYKFLPLLWIIPVILLIVGNRFYSAVAIGIALVNILVWIFTSGRFASRFNSASSLKKQVEGYASLYEMLENEDTESKLLKTLLKGGASEGKASEGLSKLAFVCTLISLRSQPLFALIINSFFQYDLYCADRLISWASSHGNEIKKDLDDMSSIEVLMSLSVVGLVSRESCFPEVIEGAFFEGRDITHPLLDPSKAVSNSITLTGGTALITGSNMSGKTTLIRTVGIACILAYTGAPVPASYVKAGKMRVMSSMRIMDSIEEQMSTFRSELVRIAKIVEAGKEDRPLLFLIDEIFRGTNSADRTEGALRVIENLSKPHIMGLMTTHDYALCDKVTETVKTVVYYHFTEKYNDDGITFDYKLHNGVSHESNAKFLMRLVGIY
jgi:hypothetical protein